MQDNYSMTNDGLRVYLNNTRSMHQRTDTFRTNHHDAAAVNECR